MFQFDEIPCAEGYYFPPGSKVCSPCHTNCLECTTNATTCTKCKIQGTINGNVCQYCGEREYWGGASCLPCSPSDCKNCFDNATKCFDCQTPKLFDETSNTCRACSSLDTYNNGATCAQCDLRCDHCDKQGICLACKGNFVVQGSICMCKTGFYLDGSGDC